MNLEKLLNLLVIAKAVQARTVLVFVSNAPISPLNPGDQLRGRPRGFERDLLNDWCGRPVEYWAT